MLDWTTVCRLDELRPDRGAAVLVEGRQIALFHLASGELYAVAHKDPVTGANVMAHGIVGDRKGVPTLASPLHKQVYDLRSGVPLDGSGGGLATWEVRVRHGMVSVRALLLARAA